VTPRLGFALSLLAACGIHAVILLVPRVGSAQTTASLPGVAIDLSETPTIMAMSAAAAPLPVRAARNARPRVPPAQGLEPVTEPDLSPAAVPQPTEPAETAPPEPEAADPAPAFLPTTEPTLPLAEPTPPPAASNSATSAAPAGSPAGGPAGPVPTAGSGAGAYGGVGVTGPDGLPGSSAGSTVGAGLIVPHPLRAIQPAYPRSARQSGMQGLVKVAATLDERGVVTSVELQVSSGSALLDQAAMEAVRRAAFTPALQAGKPVSCRVTIPIRFQLSGAAP